MGKSLKTAIVQPFCGKKSVNLQLIATEGISTVLDLVTYQKSQKIPKGGSCYKTGFIERL